MPSWLNGSNPWFPRTQNGRPVRSKAKSLAPLFPRLKRHSTAFGLRRLREADIWRAAQLGRPPLTLRLGTACCCWMCSRRPARSDTCRYHDGPMPAGYRNRNNAAPAHPEQICRRSSSSSPVRVMAVRSRWFLVRMGLEALIHLLALTFHTRSVASITCPPRRTEATIDFPYRRTGTGYPAGPLLCWSLCRIIESIDERKNRLL